MLLVPKVEMHLADACNLRCEGCNHYANHRLTGVTDLDEGLEWLEAWSRRIAPVRFTFLGGEPLINPEVPSFLRHARRLWPHAEIRLVTNGLLLGRRENLWPALAEADVLLTVSIHSEETWYRQRLAPLLQRARCEADARGFRLQLRNSLDGWYRPYRGSGKDIVPFDDGDPAASWAVCSSRHCVTVLDNALWKCPPVAHLPRLVERLGLDRAHWATPLAYEPLRLDVDDDELRAFFARGPEGVCGMCPSRPEYFVKSIR